MMGDMTATDAGDTEVDWPSELVAIYQRRYVDFVRLAYLLVGSAAVAEELTQDTFIAVRTAWEGIDKPEAYIRRALVNRCRSWFRHAAIEQRHQPPPEEHQVLGVDELWDALNRLPYRRRAAIVLRFYEDLPDDEIAAVLGCRQTTVRTAIHRGLADLRKDIQP
jgi:RNA polymerase sigma-70 factor (sigma-E family)